MAKPIDQIVMELTRESSWDSIAVQVRAEQTRFVAIGKNAPGAGFVSSERFMETADGERFYEKTDSGRDARVIVLSYSDGKRCAAVERKRAPYQEEQNSITLTKTFANEQVTGYVMRPEPLRFAFVGLIPIREAVREAERIGDGIVAGRDTAIFLFSGVPSPNVTQDLVYHLDAATSVPLKVEAYANRLRFEAGKPSWVWEAIALDDVQGYHLCLKSRYTYFVVKDDSASIRQLSEDYTIESCKFNDTYPASTFWPAYDKGVFINDLIAQKSYYNTPDKKAPVDATVKTPSVVADRIVVTDSTDLTPWVSGAGLALGSSFLVVGAYLWLKRR
jgi:hypothetical protein